MQREPRSNATPLQPGTAIPIPGAYIAATGTIDFAHANNRPVHGGVLYPSADNSARAIRRRIAREAAREARRGGVR